MRYHPLPKEMFVNNRFKFSQLLPEGSVALFVANSKMPRNGDQYFAFRQQSDFFYLTGIEQEEAVLMVFPHSPDPLLKEVLFIQAWSASKAIWEGHVLTTDEAKSISGIGQVLTHAQFEASLRDAMSHARQVFIHTYEYPKFFPAVESPQLLFARKIRAEFPGHDYRRSAPLLEQLRMVKSAGEIGLLREACRVTGQGFEKVMQLTRPGMYEFELEAALTQLFTLNRCNGHGYAPIIASGANSCVLHYSTNEDVLPDDGLLLLDFGAEYANYSADLSRTIPVSGSFTGRQRQCYDAVLRVFRQAIKLYVPGNTIASINEAVWKMMEKEMIGLGLFSEEDVRKQAPDQPVFKKYLMHGVAHHLGLDVHDVGSKYSPLAPGMVLTCEPGLYIKEENIGIRIENDILITDNGPVDLMAHIPVEAGEIEALMKSYKTLR